MVTKKAIPYEGAEPFIFVSYAHKDSALVLPILAELESKGYRVWYDDGITPGSEWSENIADHISKCAVTMAFVSPAFGASSNCRREINFALSKEKTVLSVCLQKTQLPAGLELQLSAHQFINKYELTSEESFYSKLSLCPGIDDCKKSALPEAEVTAKSDACVKKRRLPMPAVIALVVCLALVLVVGGAMLNRAIGGGEGPADTAVTTDSASETLPDAGQNEDPFEDTRTIVIHGDDMSDEDFAFNAELLRGRLDLLAGDKYSLTVEDKVMTLNISESVFCGLPIINVLRCYITRPIDIFVYDGSGLNVMLPEHAAIERTDLEAVTLKNGHLPGVDAAALGITDEDYQYIEIVLTEEWLEKNSDAVKKWGDSITIVQDLVSSWSSGALARYYTYISEDARKLYVINNDPDDKFSELVVHNLTNEPLRGSFTFVIEKKYLWEKCDESIARGENQCDADALGGNLVNIEYSYGSSADLPKLLELEMGLKKRFDVLGQPYAFGRSADDAQSFVFRTDSAKLNYSLIRLLGASGEVSLKCGLFEIKAWLPELEATVSADGTCRLKLQLKDGAVGNLESVSRLQLEKGDAVAELYIGGICFASVKLSEVITSGAVSFSNCTAVGLDKLPEYQKYIYDLAVILNSSSVVGLSLENVSFDEDSPTMFGLPSSNSEKETENAVSITSKLFEGSYSYENNGSFWVSLKLPLDGETIDRGIEGAKRLYEELDFESSHFDSLIVVLISENNETQERGRIIFRKSYSYIYSYTGEEITEGKITLNPIFSGGRLESMTEEFFEKINADPFLASMLEGK